MPVFFKVPHVSNAKTITHEEGFELVIFVVGFGPFMVFKAAGDCYEVLDSRIHDKIILI